MPINTTIIDETSNDYSIFDTSDSDLIDLTLATIAYEEAIYSGEIIPNNIPVNLTVRLVDNIEGYPYNSGLATPTGYDTNGDGEADYYDYDVQVVSSPFSNDALPITVHELTHVFYPHIAGSSNIHHSEFYEVYIVNSEIIGAETHFGAETLARFAPSGATTGSAGTPAGSGLVLDVDALLEMSSDSDSLLFDTQFDRYVLSSSDLLLPVSFENTVVAGSSNNTSGGSSDDFVMDSSRSETLSGGAGNDLIFSSGGFDTIFGGDGYDTVSFAERDDFVAVGIGGVIAGEDKDGDFVVHPISLFAAGQFMDVSGVESVIGAIEASNLITGNNGANVLSGGRFDDVIAGLGGDDIISGGEGGNDYLYGGDGEDTLSYASNATGVTVNIGTGTNNSGDKLREFENVIGSVEADKLTGSNGSNIISGGDGNDSLYGGAGADNIIGGAGDDYLHGGLGSDTLDGGDGVDTVGYTGASSGVHINLRDNYFAGFAAGDTLISIENLIGTDHNDYFYGDGEDNRLEGGDGNDQLRGEGGDDRLYGGAGNDDLRGGSGDDYLHGGDGVDTFTGHGGIDTVTYANANERAYVDLRSNTTQDAAAGETFVSIENLIGTDHDDYFYGDGEDNRLEGGDGNDQLRGEGGDDRLYGGAGNDDLRGGSGDDYLHGGDGVDTFTGHSGIDTVTYANANERAYVDLRSNTTQDAAAGETFVSIENLIGTDHDDYFYGDGEDNRLEGGDGNDQLRGEGGDDRLYGGAGNDDLRGGSGDDYLHGGDGVDTFTGHSGIDTVTYANANERAYVDLRSNTTQDAAAGETFVSIENLIGTDHDDYFYGDGEDNRLEGGDGNDQLRGEGGDDRLYGGAGNDDLRGGSGDDYLHGGDGVDTFTGHSGIDTVTYANANERAYVDLRSNTTQDAAAGETFVSIENLIGTDHDDYFYGDGEDNRLEGGDGNDQLRGEGGDDRLYGGAGNDDLRGGSGDDYLHGGDGVDTFTGHSGIDTVTYANANERAYVDLRSNTTQDAAAGETFVSIENLIGTDHDDYFYGDGEDNRLEGVDGNDQLRGEGGDDRLYGGAGNDDLRGGSGDDRLYGGAGNDAMIGHSGADTFVFTTGDDQDSIGDFQNDIDNLILDINGVNSAASAMTYATETADGVVFDFGAGDQLTVSGATLANIEDDLLLV